MRIAILYICTGKYHIFWPGFYASAQQYLFPFAEKHFFVFSDADAALFAQPAVTRIYQEKLGWPHDTLKRFHMFLRMEDELRAFDFIYFFNANCVFQERVGEDVLPSSDEGIVVVHHPGFFNKKPHDFTYDRNPKSCAYIPKGEGTHYVAGGINGGTRDAYLQLIHDLAHAVDVDEQNNVMALWHDESHLNKYILSHNHKLLSPSYCYPENAVLPFSNIITVLDKAGLGGHNALREVDETKRQYIPVHLDKTTIFRTTMSYLRSLYHKLFRRDWIRSYSQCGEDCVIHFIFSVLKVEKPSYIDIGANHPTRINNTAFFYANGSRGVNIEPNPDLFRVICKKRPHDVNLNIGIGNEQGDLTYYMFDACTLNTFSGEEARIFAEKWNKPVIGTRTVPVNTLRFVVDAYFPDSAPDVLCIDAEGFDLLIARSVADLAVKPKAVCVETLEYTETGMPEKDVEIRKVLEACGYFLFADTHVNSIFVLEELWRNRQP